MATTVTRAQAASRIAELEAIPNRSRYAENMLASAKRHLHMADHPSSGHTSENIWIAQRDAENAARLGVKYAQEA